LRAPAVLGRASSKYAGTTIRGAAFSLPFHEYLRGYFPEFEDQTGIKVAFDIQAFPIYNQRMDLELSTRGSTYDVVIVTFIYQNRWIGAGWVSDLDEFTSDANATPVIGTRPISSPVCRSRCATQGPYLCLRGGGRRDDPNCGACRPDRKGRAQFAGHIR
jgi:hypothetical protein